MSEFEKWFKTTEAYKMMEEQNYFKMNLFFFVTARNQYSHSGVQVAYLTWQHQQAEIDRLSSVLDERTKEWLQAIECGTYFENVAKPLKAENDSLKTQLNNMEACYIGKKKQVEDALSRVESLMVHAAADYENTKSTSMMCAVQELGKALRGAND